jgi:hypothetical protein
MIATGTAMLGAAALSAGGGIASGIMGSNAAKKAGDQQARAAADALAFQRKVYGDTYANLDPFIKTGHGANAGIAELYGLNGRAPNMDRFTPSPDSQFRMREGMGALENSAAARGGLLSGNFGRSAIQFGQGLASTEFSNYFDRLFRTSQLGANAASSAGGLGNAAAGQIGSTMMAQGQAQAAGTVGGANAITGGINSAANNLTFLAGMNRSSYGPTASSGYLPAGGSPMNLNSTTLGMGLY